MTHKSKVYIAGGMTGIPDFNHPAFFAAEGYLAGLGFDVFNPARIDNGSTDRPYEFYIREAVKMLCQCGSIYLLEGWEKSRGARAEEHLARLFKMDRYEQGIREPNFGSSVEQSVSNCTNKGFDQWKTNKDTSKTREDAPQSVSISKLTQPSNEEPEPREQPTGELNIGEVMGTLKKYGLLPAPAPYAGYRLSEPMRFDCSPKGDPRIDPRSAYERVRENFIAAEPALKKIVGEIDTHPMIYLFLGPGAGVGKTHCARRFAKDHGLIAGSTSDVVIERFAAEMTKGAEEINDEFFIQVKEEWLIAVREDKEKYRWLLEATGDRICRDNPLGLAGELIKKGVTVIDGIRRQEELDAIRAAYPTMLFWVTREGYPKTKDNTTIQRPDYAFDVPNNFDQPRP